MNSFLLALGVTLTVLGGACWIWADALDRVKRRLNDRFPRVFKFALVAMPTRLYAGVAILVGLMEMCFAVFPRTHVT